MSEKDVELEPIAKKDAAKKYVAVGWVRSYKKPRISYLCDNERQDVIEKVLKKITIVYHHISYQNDDGAVYLADNGQGTSKSVTDRQRTGLKQVVDVPDYFILALLSLLIFMPTGLVAVENSLKVRRALEQEDTRNAIEASNWALQHSLTSIFTGPLFACMLFLVLFLSYYQIH